ncbi:hypothetical protein KAJ89_04055 [Candidatus Parcubacteria bacterium]|nr:hypothetical protein [Candidatus Parcubacteria bacterium]
MRTLPLIGLFLIGLWVYLAYRKVKKTTLPDDDRESTEVIVKNTKERYYQKGGKRNASKRLLELLQTKVL